MENVAESKTITRHPEAIHMGISEEDLSQRNQGEGATYQERLRRSTP